MSMHLLTHRVTSLNILSVDRKTCLMEFVLQLSQFYCSYGFHDCFVDFFSLVYLHVLSVGLYMLVGMVFLITMLAHA